MVLEMKPSLVPKLAPDPNSNSILHKILDLALEIIYLLTGEDIGAKKEYDHTYSQSPIMEPSDPYMTPERRILEVTNNIIELLTGEVPLRCQDVAVYLSMEEREYLEEHCEQYKAAMIEVEPPHTSLDRYRKMSSLGLHSQIPSQEEPDSAHQGQREDFIKVKVEAEEEEDGEETCGAGYLQDQKIFPENATGASDHLKWLSVQPKEEPLECTEENLNLSAVTYHLQPAFTEHSKEHLPPSPTDTKEEPQEYPIVADFCPLISVLIHHKPSIASNSGPDLKEEPLPCEGIPNIDTWHTLPMAINDMNRIHFSEKPSSSLVVGKALETSLDGSSQDLLKSPMEAFEQGTNVCAQCGKVFSSASELAKHQSDHAESNHFICATCGKSFSGVDKLASHQQLRKCRGQYKCPDCGKRFSKKVELVRHEKNHLSVRNFQCPLCNKRFLIYYNLVNHLQTHKGEKCFPCSECGSVFKHQKRLLAHQKTHAGRMPLKCPECGIGFSEIDELTRHRQTHSEHRPHCKDCGRHFGTARELMYHQRFHAYEKRMASSLSHKTPSSESTNDSEPPTLSPQKPSENSGRSFCCTVCGKSFSQSDRLVIHQRIHVRGKPYECRQCGKWFFKEEMLIEHQKSHETQSMKPTESSPPSLEANEASHETLSGDSPSVEEQLDTQSEPATHQDLDGFHCTICCERFSGADSLAKHQQLIHAGEGPKESKASLSNHHEFQCPKCDESFLTNAERAAHRKTHTSGKVYNCSECGKGFSRRQHLVRHQKTHTGEKLISCPQCDETFYSKSELNKHSAVHGGDKALECGECGKRFQSRSHVKKHQIIHTGERRFVCSECGRSFSFKSNLTRHLRIHTGEKPYFCSDCGKSFKDMTTFRKHQLMHTGERRFVCSECGKRFTLRSNLVQHLRIHTGEKLFCSDCGKSFKDMNMLRKHQAIHQDKS